MSTDGDNIVSGRIRRLVAVRGNSRKASDQKVQEKEGSRKLYHSKMIGPIVDEYDDILHDDIVDE
ncbi:MAG: hypothetical protein AAB516_01655 [Patescibacteria group bacterium]